jgi:hypothetical protein
MKEDGCPMSIKEVRVKEQGDKPKTSYPRRVSRQQQAHYMV